MSGPPRPKCIRHRRSDCQNCIGYSRENFGVDYDETYFGDPDPRQYTGYTSYRPAGRLLENDHNEGVPK